MVLTASLAIQILKYIPAQKLKNKRKTGDWNSNHSQCLYRNTIAHRFNGSDDGIYGRKLH
jgi:hypothetical protein